MGILHFTFGRYNGIEMRRYKKKKKMKIDIKALYLKLKLNGSMLSTSALNAIISFLQAGMASL